MWRYSDSTSFASLFRVRRFLATREEFASVAHVWADQERLLNKAGQPMPVEDSYIAATARRHGLTIAAGNDRHSRRPGVRVFNPLKERRIRPPPFLGTHPVCQLRNDNSARVAAVLLHLHRHDAWPAGK